MSEEVGEIKSKSTNKRWIIAISKEKGLPTIKKQKSNLKINLLKSASESKFSKDMKKLFPDAELVDIGEENS